MRLKTALGLVSLLAVPAAAQAPSPAPAPAMALESVTVTASKPSPEVIDNFIITRTTATRVANKLARWRRAICPQTRGLGPTYANFVTGRIREIADNIGARVSDDPDCTPNIEIVFTTAPQELLDSVRKEHPDYLGYYDSQSQAQKLATVTHPIQSWYTTATGDLTGEPQVDGGKKKGVEFQATSMTVTAPGGLGTAPSITTLSFPNATARTVTGSRNNDGLSSEFFHVLIVAEPAKLLENDVGTLADYMAMLALSQPGSLDTCEPLPSITNLLAPGCTTIARTITDGDLAYLRGLYKLSPTSTLQGQRNEMRFQMEKTLVTDKK
ncbi:MAG: hypothetical protein U1E93_11710 [Alphaproteobacteria bacterium]